MIFGDLHLILTSNDAQNSFSRLKVFENLHLMTFGDLHTSNPDFKLIEIILEYYQCTAVKIPEILSYHMIFTCR